MTLSVGLSPAQAERLTAEAKRFGVTAERLADAALLDLLEQSEGDFHAAVELVLGRTEELYKRFE